MTEENNVSNWFQDNLRIIISVGIVILLVFAIYSYSKRDSRTDVVIDDSQIEEVAMTATSGDSNEINEIIDEIKDENITDEKDITVTIEKEDANDNNQEDVAAKIALEKKIAEENKRAQEANRLAVEQKQAQEAQKKAEAEKQLAEQKALETKLALEKKQAETKTEENDEQTAKDVVREVIKSHSNDTQQKDGVIVVVAVSGDSRTTLARKATAEYISKNNVSGITPAHKIYIEDYIRKAMQSNSGIYIGTEMEFDNNLINQAIESSRTLSSTQLQNLEKYVANVSSL